MAECSDKFTFGSYKGYAPEDVPLEYLEWFANNITPANESLEWIINEVIDEIEHRMEMSQIESYQY